MLFANYSISVMKNLSFLPFLIVLFQCCQPAGNNQPATLAEGNQPDYEQYLDYGNTGTELTGGVEMIPVETPAGTFNVWTKRVGNNPKMKVLLLHGGPGATHEIYESFDSYFPKEGIEYYYYDQLGSFYSDQPDDTTLWNLDRFVEEVEQVRQALDLDTSNFYLFGQSWGGLLAMQYALKYQNNLKGLIISNMVSSIPAYNQYADEELGPQMPNEVLAEVKAIEAAGNFSDPRYMDLLTEHFYTKHVCRMPVAEWPEPVNRSFEHLNSQVYVQMQGPSEFGIRGNASLLNWEVTNELQNIKVPTLSIGATYDTMDPDHMKMIAGTVQQGRFLLCPNGSHLSQFDDQEHFFPGLIKFIKDVNTGVFSSNN